MNAFLRRHSLHWLLPLLVCATLAGCSWLRAAVNRDATEAQKLSDAARRAEESGDLNEAASLLTRATDVNPDDADIHRRLGEVLLAQGHRARAADRFRQVLVLAPEDAQTHAKLARLLYQMGNLDEAESSVDAALSLDPKMTSALLLKSELAERSHNDNLALESCHRVLAGDSQNIQAQLRIANIQLRSNQPDLAAPLLRSVCQNGQATEDELFQSHWSLGLAYGQQQRWDDAADAIALAIKQRPQVNADEWYRLAYAHYLAGDVGAAKTDLAEALKRDPNHADSQALAASLNLAVAQRTVTPAGYSATSPPKPSGW